MRNCEVQSCLQKTQVLQHRGRCRCRGILSKIQGSQAVTHTDGLLQHGMHEASGIDTASSVNHPGAPQIPETLQTRSAYETYTIPQGTEARQSLVWPRRPGHDFKQNHQAEVWAVGFRGMLRPTLRTLKSGLEVLGVRVYGAPHRLFRAEIGRRFQCRFV